MAKIGVGLWDRGKPALGRTMLRGASPLNDYDVGALLGRGGFAVVHSARHRQTGRRVALKVIETSKLSDAELNRVSREVEVHTFLSQEYHPNIIQLLDKFEDGARTYLVLEHCPSGDLYQLLRKRGPIGEPEARDLVTQLLQGLRFLHERNIVHRLLFILFCSASFSFFVVYSRTLLQVQIAFPVMTPALQLAGI